MNSARLLPAARDLFAAHPLAARCSPEQGAALPWVLRFVADRPEVFEVAGALEALEALDMERGEAA
jgi:hypothetical protein